MGAIILTKHNPPLSLSDLVDLEVALESDRNSKTEQVREQDRLFIAKNPWIFQETGHAESSDRLKKAWVETFVPTPSPGKKFVSFLNLLDAVLVVIGTFFGGSAALVLLHYDGSTPINVLQYLGVFVLIQLLLLVTLALNFIFGGRLGFFQDALRHLAYQRTELFERFEGGLALIRNVRKVHSGPESWFILKVFQHFGIAFQFSALLVAFSLIGFTDLAFGWSSTLNITPEMFYRVLKVFSTPWAWLGSEWSLSMDQIRDTQFFRLENRYVSSLGAARIGDVIAATSWWRFLIGAHVTYGLMPRLLVWALSAVMFRRSLKRSGLESYAFSVVQRRLMVADPALKHDVYSRPAPGDREESSSKKIGCANIIVWRDLPADESDIRIYLEQRGIDSSEVYKVGGKSADVDGTTAVSRAQETQKPWVVLVEDWESPGKGFKNLVERLRKSHSNRAVYVVVVKVVEGKLNPADDIRSDLWRRHIRSLSDTDVWLHI